MKTMKKLLPVAIAMSAIATPAMAEFSANIGATSNYLWRGISLSGGDAAISGGIDWESDIGIYAGTWVSSLGGGQNETDFYGGYAMDMDGLGIDVGYVQYTYLNGGGNDQGGFGDYGEVYLNLSFDILSAGVAYTAYTDDMNEDGAFDVGDLYVWTGVSFDLGEDWSAGATIGYFTFENDNSKGNGNLDYLHGQVDVTKSAGDFGDVTLTVSLAANDAKNASGDPQAGKVQTVISWSKGF